MAKPLYIAGNWKSYKTLAQAYEWVEGFAKHSDELRAIVDVTSIICPPYTLLSYFSEQIDALQLPLTLGAQDVSQFDEGAYTGEVNASQIKEFAQWVIIGHSERRRNLGEPDDLLAKKVRAAKKVGLHVLYCVQDEAVLVPEGVDIIGFEPPWAISAVSHGRAMLPETAERVCVQIKAANPHTPILYGGSVTAENIKTYVNQPSIDGVIPGAASLDPEKFANLIRAAAGDQI
jgi:triosephosphate isomerase (TIM)